MTSNEIGSLCLAVGVVLGVLTVMIIAVLYVAVNGSEDVEYDESKKKGGGVR